MIIFIIGASPLESHIEKFITIHQTDDIYTVSLDKFKHPKHFCIDFNDKSNWQGILRDFRGEVDQIIFDWSVEKDVEGFGIIDIFYKLLKNDGKLYMYNGIRENIYHPIWVSDDDVFKMLVYFDHLPSSEKSCDFKCAEENFGYFIKIGNTPHHYEIPLRYKSLEALEIEIEIKKYIYFIYNTLNERYIKHKLEGNFKVDLVDKKVYPYPIQHPYYQPNPFALKYVIATKIDKEDKDEIRREASPSRDKRGTSPSRDKRDTSTIRVRSPSRFKPKKKSKKVTTNKTKKSTTNKNKKLTTNKSKKTTKKKSLV